MKETIETLIAVFGLIFIMHFCIKIGREYGTMEAFLIKVVGVTPPRYKAPEGFRGKVFFYFASTTPYTETQIEWVEGLIRENKCLTDNPTYKTDIEKVLNYMMANRCSKTDAVNAIIPSLRTKNSLEELED